MRLFLFFIILLNLLYCNVNREDFFKKEEKEVVYCDFKQNQFCDFSILKQGQVLFRGTLDLNPKPVVAMKEITFTLALNEKKFDPQEILLDLTMPEMYMGENKVKLLKKQENIYEGKGVFPECTSKFTRWNIEIFFDPSTTTNIQFDILQ